jgi:hypothetical protein
MNEKQKELFIELLKMPVGTILRKGKTERILIGLIPGMIVYRTKRSKTKHTGLNIVSFMKWAEKAEIIEVEQP